MSTEDKNMRLYEFTDSRLKKRIKSAIDKLDDSRPEDEKILQYLKSNLFGSNIQTALDASSLKSKVRPVAYDWFVSKLETLRVPLEDKVHLLKLMNNSENLIPADTFKQNVQGNILTYVSNKIKSNQAFKEIVTPLWQFKIGGQGGMGPGELFMILFSEEAAEGGKKGGDFSVGGWNIELKNKGVVPPGDSGKRVVDKLNQELVAAAKAEGFLNQLTLKSRTSFDGGWFPDFFKLYTQVKGADVAKQLFTRYLTTLYEGIPTNIIDSAFANLGTPGTEKIVAPYIFQMYKESHHWDSICLVDDNLHFINLTSFENLPANVSVKLSLKRGGDTNAVADGYALVQLGGGADTSVSQGTPAVKKTKTAPAAVNGQSQQSADPQQTLQLQATNSADDTFVSKLKDPNNPITVAWKAVKPEDKIDAKDIILDLIVSGKSDDEIAAELSNGIFESRLKRLKQLIK